MRRVQGLRRERYRGTQVGNIKAIIAYRRHFDRIFICFLCRAIQREGNQVEKCADVVVVGSGVIGSAVAYNILKSGASVLMIEAKTIGCGASSACDGFVILQSKSPGPHLTMALASEVLYRTLSEELDYDIGYRHCGGMVVIEREAELEAMRIFMSKQKDLGLDVSLIDGDEARSIEPALAKHIVGATVSSRDAQVNPLHLVNGFITAGKRLGLRIRKQTKATGFLIENGAVKGVRCGDGKLYADNVVVCNSIGAPELFSQIGYDLPIKPRRGQLAITEPVNPLIHRVMLCARYIAAKYHPELLEDSSDESVRLGVGMALEQTESGGLLIGATREFVGENRSTTIAGIRAVTQHAARIVPALNEIRIVRTFAGLRPYTPDGRAFMGAVPGYRGLYIAAGHEGDGIAYTPITGKSIAELVVDGKTEADLAPFAIDRKIEKH